MANGFKARVEATARAHKCTRREAVIIVTAKMRTANAKRGRHGSKS